MPKTLIDLTCGYCGILFKRSLGDYNQKRKQGQDVFYCSHRCMKKAHPTPGKDLEVRFWAKVKKTPTCWIWTGGTSYGGYGAIYYEGKMVHASRVSYLLHYGEFPEGFEILHTCDNPPCVRPDHLVKGTHAENMSDMKLKGRGGVGGHVRGETNGRAKLNQNAVMIIQERLAKGEKHSDIAKDFGVARTTITEINRKQNWSYSD